MPATVSIAPTEEIITELKAGRMVILVDEEDRENEGDLVIAAEHITPEAINFMAKYGRGLICLTLTRERCQHLNLPLMSSNNGTQYGTAFTLSIEAATGVTTGISAADRARTVQVAVNANSTASDLVQPGHIFPLQAVEGGVLMRAGHTEAGCDLAALAGLTPAAVICEIMKDDGTMARLPDLQVFAAEHGLKIGTVADLIEYRSRNESLVRKIGERQLNTHRGSFHATLYRDLPSGSLHIALVKGTWQPDDVVPVRVHAPFSLLDVFETEDSEHSWSLDACLRYFEPQDCGVIVLLNCSDTAGDLLYAFTHDKAKPDPSPQRDNADIRTYGVGAQILRALGVQHMQLLSKAARLPSMTGYGLEVSGHISPPEGSASC